MENRWYLIVITKPERRLRRTGKDIGVENDLLNDLGFNLCVVPQSLVVRLVMYFGVREVVKTEVLISRQPRNTVKGKIAKRPTTQKTTI